MTSITAITDVVELAQALTRVGDPVWWRGHDNARWKLVPKAFRRGFGSDRERTVALRFMAKAQTRHARCPDFADKPSWLALMQHYGIPTRLLDWSESALTAIYFAVQNDRVDGFLWALLPSHLNHQVRGDTSILSASGRTARPYFDQVFEKDNTEKSEYLAMEPSQVDIRMLVQTSAFTLHCCATPLEKHVATSTPAIVTGWRIPRKAKKDLRNDLRVIGIRRHTLFPDPESLARDISDDFGL